MKPTLQDMKRKTTITTQAIAQYAQLSIGDVFAVEAGGYTSPEKAQRVVTAFNHLSGMQLTVQDIAVHTALDVQESRQDYDKRNI